MACPGIDTSYHFADFKCTHHNRIFEVSRLETRDDDMIYNASDF